MKKSTQKLALVGGLALVVVAAYYAHKKYGTFSAMSRSITRQVFNNPSTPNFDVHRSGQTANQSPFPGKTYSGYVPQYHGFTYDLSTSQSTGSPSGAGGLGGNGGGVL